ncbi:MAG: hypothetical protein COA79_10690 [Planctomycetota bacterium]|nr:MAG: hypothetical protein COA79_10690 [Planctomycetota bacterium]
MNKPAESINEEDLFDVNKACEGDFKAFEKLVFRYQQIVHSFVTRILNDHHQTEDICQTIFFKAYLKINDLREKHKFAGWLKQISLNECRLFIRKLKKDKEQNIGEKTWGIIDPFYEEEEFEDDEYLWIKQMDKTLEALSIDQCDLLEMFYIRNLSYEQISNFLEIPLGTVKRRLFNTRKTLQSNMGFEENLHFSKKGAEHFLNMFKKLIKEKSHKEK